MFKIHGAAMTVADFKNALAAAGYPTDDNIKADDEINRAHRVGDKAGKRDIRYRLAVDGNFGYGWFIYQGGERQDFHSKGQQRTASEAAAQKAKIDAQRKASAKALKDAQAAAAKSAEYRLAHAAPAYHPYPARKQVEAGPCRVSHGALLVPMYGTDGVLCSLQTISATGDKRYLKDGKKGTLTLAGNSTIALVEGFVTGMTVHTATGWTVVICFDTAGLKAYAGQVRKIHGDSEIVICADNDQWVFKAGKRPSELSDDKATWPAGDDPRWTEWRNDGLLTNPGIEAAMAALKKVGGNARIVTPKFKNTAPRPTDFNDLQVAEGLDAVHAQLTAQPVIDRSVESATTPPSLPDATEDSNPDDVAEELSEDEKTTLPEVESLIDPLKIPGIIGDTIRAIVETAQKPQPELAMLGVFAALGAILGRRYASPMNTRTNLYTVGIASTGSGKDHPRKFIQQLLHESGFGAYLGADMIVSGAGLLMAVNKRPSQIMFVDEFGMVLEGMLGQKGSPHMKVASKIITELYSSSSGTFYGGQYADPNREPFKIPFPNLCIFGTTTLKKYVGAMNKEVIESGEFNRFIAMCPKVEKPPRKRNMGSSNPPKTIIEAWKKFLPAGNLEVLNLSSIVPEVVTVPWDGLDDRIWEMGLFEDKQNKRDGETGALWGRYTENCIKFAMMLAIDRDPASPCMITEDFDIAEAIVKQAVNFMTTLANEHMADSDHEKNCNQIQQAVKKRGGAITKSRLWKATRHMDTRQRRMAIDSLIGEGTLEQEERPTAGRNVTWYKLVKK